MLTRAEIRTSVLEILNELTETPVNVPTDNWRLEDFGLDSVEFMRFIMFLEERFELEIPDKDIDEDIVGRRDLRNATKDRIIQSDDTVGSVLDYLESRLNEQ